MSPGANDDQVSLVLAAEDCEPDKFQSLHVFSSSDEGVISKLIAHGPVLLRGGRGTGKSALMIEASRRLAPVNQASTAWGIYVSLRHLELLRSKGSTYEAFLCSLVIREIQKTIGQTVSEAEPTITGLQHMLTRVYVETQKRVVLFFDDAAHIGREASLHEFFDIFRTISSSVVSCKAAIYPGVTKFGSRFDIYNDATIVDVIRNEDFPGYSELFGDVIAARYPAAAEGFSSALPREKVGGFLARAVLGNMRGFVFSCNYLFEQTAGKPVGLVHLQQVLLHLSSNYFWPLLDELRPKLGMYEPLIEPAQEAAGKIFEQASTIPGRRSILIHRDIIERLPKIFEILEYVGFISRREASKAMKSGGRGARYVLNLCALLEKIERARLTDDLLGQWTAADKNEPLQFHKTGTYFSGLQLPPLQESADLGIFQLPIDKLEKSVAYPYGLTESKLRLLKQAGFVTIGDLAEATDERLLALNSVGESTLQRFRNIVGQAVWM